MKLLDILLVETSLANIGVGDVIDRRTADESLIREVQGHLKRHTLVGGTLNTTTNTWSINNGSAWPGAIDGVWSEEMDAKVEAWHNSINAQLAASNAAQSEQLEVNRSIGNEDRRWLTADVNDQGLLIRTAETGEEINPINLNVRWPITNQIANPDVNAVTDAASFISGIGESGWNVILAWYSNRLYRRPDGSFTKSQHQRTQEVIRWMQEYVFRMPPSGDNIFYWYNRVQTNVFRNNFPLELPSGLSTQYQDLVRAMADRHGVDNTSVQINSFPDWMARFSGWNRDIQGFWQTLFLHFAAFATMAFADNAQIQQRRATDAAEDEAARDQNEVVNLSNTDVESACLIFHNAVDGPGTDENALASVYGRLRNALDYDALEAFWTANYATNSEFGYRGKTMDEVAISELSDSDYIIYVERYLRACRRIAPEILYNNIQFEGDEISVTVPSDARSIAGQTFTIRRGLQANQAIDISPDPVGRIQEDLILRTAIEDSGAAVPDLFVAPTSDDMVAAATTFTDMLNRYAPFMHRYYVGDVPFDGTDLATIGKFRLRGIVENMAAMPNARSEDMVTMVRNEIDDDIRFLVGDGNDDERAAANIYFDPLYQNEGEYDGFMPLGDEEVELSEEAEAFIEAFLGNEDTVFDAARRLVDLPNFEDLYVDEIYPGFYQRVRRPLERVIGDRSTVVNAHAGQLDRTAMSIILRALDDLPKTVPVSYARMLDDAIDADRGALESASGAISSIVTGETRAEEILQLLVRIRNKETFDLVDKYYRGDLLQDLIDEDLPGFDVFLRRLGINNPAQDLPDVSEDTRIQIETLEEQVEEQILSDEAIARLSELPMGSTEMQNAIDDLVRSLFANEQMREFWELSADPANLARRMGDDDFRAATIFIASVNERISALAQERGDADPLIVMISRAWQRDSGIWQERLAAAARFRAETERLGIDLGD